MVSILGPGDYFGELGLLFGTPRTATVRAATHCELIMLSKHNLDQVLVKFPIVRRYVSSHHHQHSACCTCSVHWCMNMFPYT